MVQLRLLVTALLVLIAMASPGSSQEVDYFVVRIPPSDGDYDPDHVVSREAIPHIAWYQMDSDWRVVVDVESEAYIVSDARPGATYDGARIVGKKPRGKAIEGNVYSLLRSREDNQKSVLVRRPFQVAAQPDVAASRDEFLVAKGRYYERLWAEQHAGSAIWRNLAIASLKEAGQKVENFSPRWPMGTAGGADSTFALMSGGRAISENLQLDRQLPVSDVDAPADASVDLSTVGGITIAEVDWSQRLGEVKVELDPLAAYVPHDQYALFLPVSRR